MISWIPSSPFLEDATLHYDFYDMNYAGTADCLLATASIFSFVCFCCVINGSKDTFTKAGRAMS